MTHSGSRRVLAALAILLAAALFAGVAQANDPIDAEARAIAKDLQCPICGGQSVADSQSKLAQDMREIIRKRLAQGESREAITAYLVDRYGEAILREPPRHGFNQLLWLLPYLSMVAGGGLLGLVVYRWQARRRNRIGAPGEAAEEADLRAFEDQFEAELRGHAPW
jgi:cytochrome c-type biogenesis protein CcmH